MAKRNSTSPYNDFSSNGAYPLNSRVSLQGFTAPDPVPTVIPLKTSLNHRCLGNERGWPDYEACLRGAPPNKEGTGPSRSHADFFWCLMSAQRRHSIEETTDKLLEVSARSQERARLHDDGYALITAQNAAAAAEQGRKRGRG